MRIMLIFAVVLAVALSVRAQNGKNKRPRITAIDHVVFYTTAPEDVAKLYTGTLGLASVAPIEPGEKLRYMVASQWVGYSPAPDPKSTNRWDHIAFMTDDIAGLRSYLESKGLKPAKIEEQSDKSRTFSVTDPEGHKVEFVERSKPERKAIVPASACSRRLMHAGVIVKDRAAADHFYRDILGFRLYWYGQHEKQDHPAKPDWVSMQVPDGTDWFEYMLNIAPDADLRTTGVMNHISFGVADMDKAEAILVANGWKPHGDEHQQLGLDGKKQLNVFDADFNRVELMEFKPSAKPCCSDFQGTHPSERE